jgi:hypothetical protein
MQPNPSRIARRDVLLLRSTPQPRVYELPCQRLYMRYVDARRVSAREPPTDEAGPGEPDAVVHVAGPAAIVAALAMELEAADVLRVRDREWLADSGLRRDLEGVIAAFTARGGRVEFGSPSE